MTHYCDVGDIPDLDQWLKEGLRIKKQPGSNATLGKGKTLCLLFFNNSLRTRLSTQLAARHLGMEVIVMNFGSEGWKLEFGDGTVMDGASAEHVREAAAVVGAYADVIGVRAFAGLQDREADNAEEVLRGFTRYSGVPVLNLESATAHPLQALADALTISEHQKARRPKVVLSWAPHPRALPQAVPNSFVRMIRRMDAELTITHPEGYELPPGVTGGLVPEYDQEKALEGADFVYVKNWSSYSDYGAILNRDPSWMMTKSKLGKAWFMHCLPVRRNVVVEDSVLDGDRSLILQQAANRTVAAELALTHLLKSNS